MSKKSIYDRLLAKGRVLFFFKNDLPLKEEVCHFYISVRHLAEIERLAFLFELLFEVTYVLLKKITVTLSF